MPDAEVRNLKIAVALLVLLSTLRWGATLTRDPGDVAGEGAVLDALVSESRQAVDDDARRSRPLGDGERMDVNRAPPAELDRLPGIGPALAGAIAAARDSGVVFRRPDDLLAVRGIGPAMLADIRAWVDTSNPPGRPGRPSIPARRSGGGGAPVGAGQVDVNHAGPDALQALPGVGPVTAGRIVEARATRPFTSVDDLARVSGIGPATIERLRGLVRVGPRR